MRLYGKLRHYLLLLAANRRREYVYRVYLIDTNVAARIETCLLRALTDLDVYSGLPDGLARIRIRGEEHPRGIVFIDCAAVRDLVSGWRL